MCSWTVVADGVADTGVGSLTSFPSSIPSPTPRDGNQEEETGNPSRSGATRFLPAPSYPPRLRIPSSAAAAGDEGLGGAAPRCPVRDLPSPPARRHPPWRGACLQVVAAHLDRRARAVAAHRHRRRRGQHPARSGTPGDGARRRGPQRRSVRPCESYRGPADCSFLVYLAARAPSLKGLHVTSDLDPEPSEEFVEHVVKKLSLLERLVLSQGYIMKNVLRTFLGLCPRLTLLDAGGCRLYEVMGSRLQARFYSTIKEVKLPQQSSGGCGCCRQHAVRYAEEHDY
ncbi:unnamed protein product [Urochloa humidicola]